MIKEKRIWKKKSNEIISKSKILEIEMEIIFTKRQLYELKQDLGKVYNFDNLDEKKKFPLEQK